MEDLLLQKDQRFSYIESLSDFFSQFDFPLIYDADTGHKAPQMTLINGSYAEVECQDGQGSITQFLFELNLFYQTPTAETKCFIKLDGVTNLGFFL